MPVRIIENCAGHLLPKDCTGAVCLRSDEPFFTTLLEQVEIGANSDIHAVVRLVEGDQDAQYIVRRLTEVGFRALGVQSVVLINQQHIMICYDTDKNLVHLIARLAGFLRELPTE